MKKRWGNAGKIERRRHNGKIYNLYFAGGYAKLSSQSIRGKVFWRRLTVVSIFGTFQIVKDKEEKTEIKK